ncbi:ATP-binding protein [Ornithinimicrobium sp. LYQ121]
MPTPSPARDDREATLTERLSAYRTVREQVERLVLPLATSVDGVSFVFQASLYGLALRRGGYIVLGGDGPERLGQITDLSVASERAAAEGLAAVGTDVVIRMARGEGTLLDSDGNGFHDATVRPALPHEVVEWLARARPGRAALPVGELLRAPGVAAVLDSGGLDRHTFMCGQSGSGKTYALGLLLERVLAETALPVVVLDPNSDYVRLASLRDGADPELADRFARVVDDITVWGDGPTADQPLRLRFSDLDPEAQAAVLGLDPIADLDEYAVLRDLLREQEHDRPLVTGFEQLLQAETPGARSLGVRARNLGVLDWGLWSRKQRSIVDEICGSTARCTVVDLGSLGTPQEQRLVAQAVLSALWQTRATRRPRLIVVDEAHNVCPAQPGDAVSALSTETAIQIAAEGRKFGLYLLTSTQRPHKVHKNVVSQCDNLFLMRMNSHDDLAELSGIFSFVPEGLMAGATTFAMGEALVAGKILRRPAYVRMGERVTQEGGADIPPTWADPR